MEPDVVLLLGFNEKRGLTWDIERQSEVDGRLLALWCYTTILNLYLVLTASVDILILVGLLAKLSIFLLILVAHRLFHSDWSEE